MLKSLLRSIRKVFARKKVAKPSPIRLRNGSPYTGVPAPDHTPYDPWFDTQIRSAKQRLADKVLALEKAFHKKQDKEQDDIHEVLYRRSARGWSTWTEGVTTSGGGMTSSGEGR